MASLQTQTLNVVFDIGNVVLRWNPLSFYIKFFDGDRKKAVYFLDNICSFDWNIEQDRGRSWEEATQILLDQYPEWEAPIRAYYDRWNELLTGPIEENAILVDELSSQKQPLYAITNFSAHAYHDCEQKYPFLQKFQGVVISSDEQLVKPDRAIFDVFLARYNLSPENCLFIDDTLPNIQTAQELGMETVHYKLGETDLRKELKKYNLPV